MWSTLVDTHNECNKTKWYKVVLPAGVTRIVCTFVSMLRRAAARSQRPALGLVHPKSSCHFGYRVIFLDFEVPLFYDDASRGARTSSTPQEKSAGCGRTPCAERRSADADSAGRALSQCPANMLGHLASMARSHDACSEAHGQPGFRSSSATHAPACSDATRAATGAVHDTPAPIELALPLSITIIGLDRVPAIASDTAAIFFTGHVVTAATEIIMPCTTEPTKSIVGVTTTVHHAIMISPSHANIIDQMPTIDFASNFASFVSATLSDECMITSFMGCTIDVSTIVTVAVTQTTRLNDGMCYLIVFASAVVVDNMPGAQLFLGDPTEISDDGVLDVAYDARLHRHARAIAHSTTVLAAVEGYSQFLAAAGTADRVVRPTEAPAIAILAPRVVYPQILIICGLEAVLERTGLDSARPHMALAPPYSPFPEAAVCIMFASALNVLSISTRPMLDAHGTDASAPAADHGGLDMADHVALLPAMMAWLMLAGCFTMCWPHGPPWLTWPAMKAWPTVADQLSIASAQTANSGLAMAAWLISAVDAVATAWLALHGGLGMVNGMALLLAMVAWLMADRPTIADAWLASATWHALTFWPTPAAGLAVVAARPASAWHNGIAWVAMLPGTNGLIYVTAVIATSVYALTHVAMVFRALSLAHRPLSRLGERELVDLQGRSRLRPLLTARHPCVPQAPRMALDTQPRVMVPPAVGTRSVSDSGDVGHALECLPTDAWPGYCIAALYRIAIKYVSTSTPPRSRQATSPQAAGDQCTYQLTTANYLAVVTWLATWLALACGLPWLTCPDFAWHGRPAWSAPWLQSIPAVLSGWLASARLQFVCLAVAIWLAAVAAPPIIAAVRLALDAPAQSAAWLATADSGPAMAAWLTSAASTAVAHARLALASCRALTSWLHQAAQPAFVGPTWLTPCIVCIAACTQLWMPGFPWPVSSGLPGLSSPQLHLAWQPGSLQQFGYVLPLLGPPPPGLGCQSPPCGWLQQASSPALLPHHTPSWRFDAGTTTIASGRHVTKPPNDGESPAIDSCTACEIDTARRPHRPASLALHSRSSCADASPLEGPPALHHLSATTVLTAVEGYLPILAAAGTDPLTYSRVVTAAGTHNAFLALVTAGHGNSGLISYSSDCTDALYSVTCALYQHAMIANNTHFASECATVAMPCVLLPAYPSRLRVECYDPVPAHGRLGHFGVDRVVPKLVASLMCITACIWTTALPVARSVGATRTRAVHTKDGTSTRMGTAQASTSDAISLCMMIPLCAAHRAIGAAAVILLCIYTPFATCMPIPQRMASRPKTRHSLDASPSHDGRVHLPEPRLLPQQPPSLPQIGDVDRTGRQLSAAVHQADHDAVGACYAVASALEGPSMCGQCVLGDGILRAPLRHWPWYRTTWVLPFCEPGTTMVAAVAVADAAAVASAAVAASVDSTAAAVVVVVCVSTSAVVSTVAVNIATVANASAAISTVTAAAANAATVSAAAVTRGSPDQGRRHEHVPGRMPPHLPDAQQVLPRPLGVHPPLACS